MDGLPFLAALDTGLIPQDLIATEGDLIELLSKIVITSYSESELADGSTALTYEFGFSEEVSFDVVGIDGIELVLGGDNNEVLTLTWTGGGIDDYRTALLGTAAFRIKNSLLVPVIQGGDGFVPDPNIEHFSVALSGGMEIDSQLSVTFTGGNAFQLTPVMIGDSGLVIEGEIAFDFSQNDLLPESAAMGLTASWKGVVFKSLTLHLPDSLNIPILPDDLVLENFNIGNGGVAGGISGTWSNTFDAVAGVFTGDGVGNLFGLAFALEELGMTLAQNTLTSSFLKGSLKVPFFEEVIQVELGLTNDGDFVVSLASPDGLLTLHKPDVISIDINSLEFVQEEGEFLFKLSGTVTPEIGGLNWPSFQLDALTISSTGQVKVEGGWINLPELKTLDFHGFKVEISQIGFGTDEEGGTDFNWVGFSGGIQIVGSLPLNGGVEGLKVMWNKATNEPKLKIGGVSLGFEIDNVLTFDGLAHFIDEEDPATGTQIRGFKGGFEVNLIPLNGAGFDAQFIAGNKGSYNFFYLFLDVNLPLGVPILPPAVGLYGLAGLFAYNMTLDYQALVGDNATEPRPEMTDVSNWIDQEGAMAFGAGVTLGTLADNGFTAKAKVVFAILVPGPVILIEGQVKVLSLKENYPFTVLAVLDIGSGTFLMNIGASYSYPADTGDLLNISGTAEAYFPTGDLNGWYLYLGQESPDSKRLKADVISFFTAQAYLMVDQKGLDFGVSIGYSLDKKYGPLRVILESWISGGMSVSWMPLQAKGTISWYGRAELSVAKIGIGLSVEATASVEVPKPLSLTGEVTVQLKTPIGKPKAKVKLKWEKESTPAYPIPLSPILGIEHRKVSENWDVIKSSRYGADDDGLWNEDGSLNDVPALNELPVVPPDVQLVLNFDKSVVDAGLVGSNNPTVPSPESSGAYEFEFELNNMVLEYSESYAQPNWQPFELAGTDFSLTAAWQALPDPGGMVNTKLVVNAQSALEISRVLEDNSYWMSTLGLYNPDYPCPDPVLLEWRTANFEAYATEDILYPMFVEDGWIFYALYPMRIAGYDAPWLGTEHALSTELELELSRCWLIQEFGVTPAGAMLEEKGIQVHACSDPLGTLPSIPFVQFREGAYPLDYERTTELYIDQSVRNAVQGVTPAYLEAPKVSSEWPIKVTVMLMVNVTPDTRIIAKDEFGATVDYVDEFSDCARNPHTYELVSDNGNPIQVLEFIGTNFQIKELCWVEKYHTDENQIWIFMPEEMSQLTFDFSKGSKGSIQFFDELDAELEEILFDIPESTSKIPAQPIEISVEGLLFRSVLLKGSFDLLQIHGLPQVSVDAVAGYEERSTHFQTTLEENWGKHTAQILLPNTHYRLRVETTAKRKKKTNASWTTQLFTEYMYFKTGNPPGIYNGQAATSLNPDAATAHYPEAGPLTDLKPYIEATIPAGAPPNEPQILHYRSYDVGLTFNDSYIEQMYQAAGYELGIRLLDNNLQPVLDENGSDLFVNGWGDNTELSLTDSETQYQTLWDDQACIGVNTLEPESNQELFARSPRLELLPRTQYKAQIWANAAYPLYEFSFMTSRYASFSHQVHSFQDAVWDQAALHVDPSFQVDQTLLAAVLNNTSGVEEWIQFEQLMDLFDLNPKPLPHRMEIALLRDDVQSYGLLLESPEPMPADRVTSIQLSKTLQPHVVYEFDGDIKLVQATDSLVEVLLLRSADLSGYIIEYRDHVGTAFNPYTSYYTFDPGSAYPAGTRLLIHNGNPPAGSAVTENELLYAGHPATSLTSAQTDVRIQDASGTLVHERIFIKAGRFTDQTTRLIRNLDETRMFIFIEDGALPYADLPDATYRISLDYLRDGDGDSPPQRRFGYTDPEATYVAFSLPPLLPGHL